MADVTYFIYLTPMLFIWGLYYSWHTRRHRRAACVRNEGQKAGLISADLFSMTPSTFFSGQALTHERQPRQRLEFMTG